MSIHISMRRSTIACSRADTADIVGRAGADPAGTDTCADNGTTVHAGAGTHGTDVDTADAETDVSTNDDADTGTGADTDNGGLS